MEDEIEKLKTIVEDHEMRIRELESIHSPKVDTSISTRIAPEGVVASFRALDLSNRDYVYNLSGLALYLAIISIARLELAVDGLSPSEISKICKEKVRISAGVDRSTISNSLSNAGAKVDRIDNPRGNGFAYKIMRAGENHIEDARPIRTSSQ